VRLSCNRWHPDGDPLIGQPLCPGCFDYPGAVLWNAHVPRLWVRTSLEIYRAVARTGHLSTRAARSVVRLSYIKVVEFQRRGLVHLHVVIRADGSDGPSELPPEWLTAEVLAECVATAVGRVSVASTTQGVASLARADWGSEYDIRELAPSDGGDSTAIAAYVAKYATKTADGTSWLAHPIRSSGQLERLEVRPHIAQFVRTAWALGQLSELRSLHLRAHAHTLGYTGQFSSKSQRFSTTFGALRAARVEHVKGEMEGGPDFDGAWHYVGRGYAHPEANQVAASLLEASARVPRRFHRPSTTGSTTP
jgi:hypothetical protein